MTGHRQPQWAVWNQDSAARPWTVGLEEEIMLLDGDGWGLADRSDEVLPHLSAELATRVSPETHSSVLEVQTGPHARASAATAELAHLRRELAGELAEIGLCAAVAGLHPFAVWSDVGISSGERYQRLYGSMRELARREPTFALHVHVATPDPETATVVLDRMRAHLPLLLALSANSPFWQGRDTGLASARTPLFQAFPRVGIPRAFTDYAEYVEAVDLLIRCHAIPEPSFLWWDVRLQPRFGTVEVRIMDAQSTVADSGALLALVQSLVCHEAQAPSTHSELAYRPEVLIENRFLAARDGMAARLIDADAGARRPVSEILDETLAMCRPTARELGCLAELDGLADGDRRSGATHQRRLAEAGDGLPGLVAALAAEF